MNFNGPSGEFLQIESITKDNYSLLEDSIETGLTLLWLEKEAQFTVDNIKLTFKPSEVVFFTEFHKVKVQKIEAAKMLRFNKSFYCVLNHDKKVGCRGILFFGASNLPLIDLDKKSEDLLSTVWKMFLQEMEMGDDLQLEMLQSMLKRFLILCTRLYKAQHKFNEFSTENIDIIRNFNYLVETHFKTKHTVSEYAELLNKSPKTLSNAFAKHGKKSPLEYIQERRLLEAKRLLHHTDQSVKEIGYEIGYNDLQTFSRFFKTHIGISPTQYKAQKP